MPNGRQLWNQRDNRGIGDTHSIATEYTGEFGRILEDTIILTTWMDTLSASLGILNTNTFSALNFSLICCLIRFKPTKTVGSKDPRNNRTFRRHQPVKSNSGLQDVGVISIMVWLLELLLAGSLVLFQLSHWALWTREYLPLSQRTLSMRQT